MSASNNQTQNNPSSKLKKELIENDSIDKDNSVENVIRQLRKKRSIEVKKVNNKNTKSKRKSPKVEDIGEVGKSSIGSASSKQNGNLKSGAQEQKNISGHTDVILESKHFLEVEEDYDEIEDYLEIDESVVEDLEALIPEEEIVSISNSLILPEEQLPLKKEDIVAPEQIENSNIENSSKIASKSLMISNSCKYEKSIQEIDDKTIIQQNAPSVGNIESNNERLEDTKKTNNNKPNIKSNNISLSQKIKATKRTSEMNRNAKKQRTPNKDKETPITKKKSPKNKITKQNAEGSMKITDFFNTNSIKSEMDCDISNPGTNVADCNENNSRNADFLNESSATISKLEKGTADKTRSLRSRSKVIQEPKKKGILQINDLNNTREQYSKDSDISNITDNSNASIDNQTKNINIDVESGNQVTVSLEKKSCKRETDDRELDRAQDEMELNEWEPTRAKLSSAKKEQPRHSKPNVKTLPRKGRKTPGITKDNEKPQVKKNTSSNSITESATVNCSELTAGQKDGYENDPTNSNIDSQETSQKQGKKRRYPRKKNPPMEIEASTSNNNIIGNVENQESRNEAIPCKKNKVIQAKLDKVFKMDTCPVNTEHKNDEAKMQIYDFDDKSVDETIEFLHKSTKNKKVLKSKGSLTKEKPTVNEGEEYTENFEPKISDKLLAKQVDSSSINNNKPNTLPNSIESCSKMEMISPSESEEHIKLSNIVNTSSDIGNSLTSGFTPKVEEANLIEIQEVDQNWAPTYGPYKRVDRCNVCLKTFTTYKKLKAHKKTHEVENPYQCSQCDGSFQDVEKLAAHLRIHRGKMPFACKKCDATFWTQFQLEKHQLVHVLKKVSSQSKPPSKIFKCEECGKEFKKICDLERHTRVHTGEKPSVCNICNKRFQQPYNLNKHLHTHTQEKNFECVICQKKFGRNDVLNRHVLTHSMVKPFKCHVCQRTFIRSSQLKLHLKKHHDLEYTEGDPENRINNADEVEINNPDDPGMMIDDEVVASASTDEVIETKTVLET